MRITPEDLLLLDNYPYQVKEPPELQALISQIISSETKHFFILLSKFQAEIKALQDHENIMGLLNKMDEVLEQICKEFSENVDNFTKNSEEDLKILLQTTLLLMRKKFTQIFYNSFDKLFFFARKLDSLDILVLISRVFKAFLKDEQNFMGDDHPSHTKAVEIMYFLARFFGNWPLKVQDVFLEPFFMISYQDLLTVKTLFEIKDITLEKEQENQQFFGDNQTILNSADYKNMLSLHETMENCEFTCGKSYEITEKAFEKHMDTSRFSKESPLFDYLLLRFKCKHLQNLNKEYKAQLIEVQTNSLIIQFLASSYLRKQNSTIFCSPFLETSNFMLELSLEKTVICLFGELLIPETPITHLNLIIKAIKTLPSFNNYQDKGDDFDNNSLKMILEILERLVSKKPEFLHYNHPTFLYEFLSVLKWKLSILLPFFEREGETSPCFKLSLLASWFLKLCDKQNYKQFPHKVQLKCLKIQQIFYDYELFIEEFQLIELSVSNLEICIELFSDNPDFLSAFAKSLNVLTRYFSQKHRNFTPETFNKIVESAVVPHLQDFFMEKHARTPEICPVINEFLRFFKAFVSNDPKIVSKIEGKTPYIEFLVTLSRNMDTLMTKSRETAEISLTDALFSEILELATESLKMVKVLVKNETLIAYIKQESKQVFMLVERLVVFFLRDELVSPIFAKCLLLKIGSKPEDFTRVCAEEILETLDFYNDSEMKTSFFSLLLRFLDILLGFQKDLPGILATQSENSEKSKVLTQYRLLLMNCVLFLSRFYEIKWSFREKFFESTYKPFISLLKCPYIWSSFETIHREVVLSCYSSLLSLSKDFIYDLEHYLADIIEVLRDALKEKPRNSQFINTVCSFVRKGYNTNLILCANFKPLFPQLLEFFRESASSQQNVEVIEPLEVCLLGLKQQRKAYGRNVRRKTELLAVFIENMVLLLDDFAKNTEKVGFLQGFYQMLQKAKSFIGYRQKLDAEFLMLFEKNRGFQALFAVVLEVSKGNDAKTREILMNIVNELVLVQLSSTNPCFKEFTSVFSLYYELFERVSLMFSQVLKTNAEKNAEIIETLLMKCVKFYENCTILLEKEDEKHQESLKESSKHLKLMGFSEEQIQEACLNVLQPDLNNLLRYLAQNHGVPKENHQNNSIINENPNENNENSNNCNEKNENSNENNENSSNNNMNNNSSNDNNIGFSYKFTQRNTQSFTNNFNFRHFKEFKNFGNNNNNNSTNIEKSSLVIVTQPESLLKSTNQRQMSMLFQAFTTEFCLVSLKERDFQELFPRIPKICADFPAFFEETLRIAENNALKGRKLAEDCKNPGYFFDLFMRMLNIGLSISETRGFSLEKSRELFTKHQEIAKILLNNENALLLDCVYQTFLMLIEEKNPENMRFVLDLLQFLVSSASFCVEDKLLQSIFAFFLMCFQGNPAKIFEFFASKGFDLLLKLQIPHKIPYRNHNISIELFTDLLVTVLDTVTLRKKALLCEILAYFSQKDRELVRLSRFFKDFSSKITDSLQQLGLERVLFVYSDQSCRNYVGVFSRRCAEIIEFPCNSQVILQLVLENIAKSLFLEAESFDDPKKVATKAVNFAFLFKVLHYLIVHLPVLIPEIAECQVFAGKSMNFFEFLLEHCVILVGNPAIELILDLISSSYCAEYKKKLYFQAFALINRVYQRIFKEINEKTALSSFQSLRPWFSLHFELFLLQKNCEIHVHFLSFFKKMYKIAMSQYRLNNTEFWANNLVFLLEITRCICTRCEKTPGKKPFCEEFCREAHEMFFNKEENKTFIYPSDSFAQKIENVQLQDPVFSRYFFNIFEPNTRNLTLIPVKPSIFRDNFKGNALFRLFSPEIYTKTYNFSPESLRKIRYLSTTPSKKPRFSFETPSFSCKFAMWLEEIQAFKHEECSSVFFADLEHSHKSYVIKRNKRKIPRGDDEIIAAISPVRIAHQRLLHGDDNESDCSENPENRSMFHMRQENFPEVYALELLRDCAFSFENNNSNANKLAFKEDEIVNSEENESELSQENLGGIVFFSKSYFQEEKTQVFYAFQQFQKEIIKLLRETAVTSESSRDFDDFIVKELHIYRIPKRKSSNLKKIVEEKPVKLEKLLEKTFSQPLQLFLTEEKRFFKYLPLEFFISSMTNKPILVDIFLENLRILGESKEITAKKLLIMKWLLVSREEVSDIPLPQVALPLTVQQTCKLYAYLLDFLRENAGSPLKKQQKLLVFMIIKLFLKKFYKKLAVYPFDEPVLDFISQYILTEEKLQKSVLEIFSIITKYKLQETLAYLRENFMREIKKISQIFMDFRASPSKISETKARAMRVAFFLNFLNRNTAKDKVFLEDSEAFVMDLSDFLAEVQSFSANLVYMQPFTQALLPLIKAFVSVFGEDFRVRGLKLQENSFFKEIDVLNGVLSSQKKYVLCYFLQKIPKLLNYVLDKDKMGFPSEFLIENFPSLLSFHVKRRHFLDKLKKSKEGSSQVELNNAQQPIKMKINRSNIFADSYEAFKDLTSEELQRRLIISFDQEEGIDAGGLTKEWFLLLSKEMFNQDYALFVRNPKGVTFQPNPASAVNSDHLNYFYFIGRVIGKAIYDGFLTNCYFMRSFYKHILGHELEFEDIKDLDYEYYENLKWILQNKIDGSLHQQFCYFMKFFDEYKTIDLIPNGRNIEVNDENKRQYVQFLCEMLMKTSISEQTTRFLQGFYELIPKEMISFFDCNELELLITGSPEINIQDLQQNTEYYGYTPQSQAIIWFWEVLNSFVQAEKAIFLQFVTGSSKVPIEGFKALSGIGGIKKFSIHKLSDIEKLPTSHTCVNQLNLPDYPTKEILQKKLLYAIKEGKEGFGFI